jgi:hypothetical protein
LLCETYQLDFSGTPVRRPRGQTKPVETEPPIFGTSKVVDFELELVKCEAAASKFEGIVCWPWQQDGRSNYNQRSRKTHFWGGANERLEW